MTNSGKKPKGFSLVEALVAIAILLTVVSGVMLLVNQSIQSGEDVSSRLAASYLASDAIEYLRYERDSNWLSSGGSFDAWATDSNGIGSCTGGDICRVDTRKSNEDISDCGSECEPLEYDSGAKEYGYGIGSDSPYTRTVKVVGQNDIDSDGSIDELIIEVTMSWDSATAGTSSLVLTDTLSSWGD